MRWYSIEKISAYPIEGEEVLCYEWASQTMFVGYYRIDEETGATEWFVSLPFGGLEACKSDLVTHWMFLPSEPLRIGF